MEYLKIHTEPQTNTNEKWYIEAEYLKMIFIDKNYNETIGWYNTMLKALPPDDYLSDLATRYYEGCLGKTRNNENSQELLALLTEAIRIAPSNCPILMDCHMLRAEILIKSEDYMRAIVDLNMCKNMSGPKFHTNLQLLINSTKCFIQTNNRTDAEHTIEFLRSHRRKYNGPRKGKNTCANQDEKLSDFGANNIWKTIRELEKQLRKLAEIKRHMNGKAIDRCSLSQPYLGYTPLYPKIKNASVACSLVENSVHANRTIPATEVILVEQPYVCELINLRVQCSVCQDNVINLISCNECHMISYCSLECKKSDEVYHKYECSGYKMMLLPLLDAKLVLRLLLRGLMLMKRKIFNRTQCQSANNATDLFNVLLMEAHKDCSLDYFNILIMDAKYEKLCPQDFEYCTMMSLRLSVYLANFTTAIDDFFVSVRSHLSNNEINIFLGALIMRHTAHVKLKKFKLTFNMLATVDSQTKLNDFSTDEHLDDSSKALNDEDCVLYALRVAQLQAKVQKFLEHGSRKCYSRPELSSQIDSNPSSANYDRLHHNIVRAIFGKAIAKNAAETKDRNDAFRIYVDEMYKEFFFHHNYTQSLEMPQTLRCIYPTLALIDHSCDPNCFVVILQPGTVIVKALRQIDPGENLTISYGVHCKQHPRDFRTEFLQSRLIECKCKYCNIDIDENDSNARNSFPIECKHCNGLISYTAKPNCRFCNDRVIANKPVKELLFRISEIGDKIRNEEKKFSSNAIIQAEFTILISLIEIWGKNHVDVYRQKLKLATFLANQNFVVQAYIFFKDIPIQARNFYPDMSMKLYSEYMHTLRPLLRMLEYNVQYNKSLVTKQPNLFSEIYEILLYIATQMMQLNEALERSDDSELGRLYKRILGYKDAFNPGISSPLSAGSDTSLDGVRFFNGSAEYETPTFSKQSIQKALGLQSDSQFDRLRGSSDLNACLIIAEAYNSGYKHLDLFSRNWSDESDLSDGEFKPTENDNECVVVMERNGAMENSLRMNFENAEAAHEAFEENDFVISACNGHKVNDMSNHIMIEMNGVDANLSIYNI